jgi:hypothetical protein
VGRGYIRWVLYTFNDSLALPESEILFLPLANVPQRVLPVDSFTLSAYVTLGDSANYANSFGR